MTIKTDLGYIDITNEVLAGIGRKHSAQDILDCYADARKAGHEDINICLLYTSPSPRDS